MEAEAKDMSGRREALLAWLCVTVIMASACGTRPSIDAESSPTPPPVATASPTSSPLPSPELSPTGLPVPTVRALGAHLDSILDSVSTDGTLACEGSGPIGHGTALACHRDHPGQDWVETVYVAVLDDEGRYTFTTPYGFHAGPDDYPTGTSDCEVLSTPPETAGESETEVTPAGYHTGGSGIPAAGPGRVNGLDYSALLYQWFRLGQPATMDEDGDSRPCEDAYAADVINRVMASPLVLDSAPRAGQPTMTDVVAHAEAVLSGLVCPTHLPGCLVEGAAQTGATTTCLIEYPAWPQTFEIYIAVLDDAGRYWMTYTLGEPDRWPAGSGCAEYAQPAPGMLPHESHGLSYGLLLYQWMTLGRPSDWDTDGDGRPCEEYWTSDEIEAVMSSTLRP